MANDLTSTTGVYLVTIWVQTLLQGCGMLQGWLYFHWYKKDSWGIKAMVVALLVIETFQSIVYFQITYVILIDGFGDVNGLFVIHWQDSAQLLATYLSAFIVQIYFGYCIYMLNRKNKVLPGIILVLALTEISTGVAQTIRTQSSSVTSFTQIPNTKVTYVVEAVAAFLCDIVITASLVYNLGIRKTGIKSTNTLLETLTVNAINRGMLTALCALINVVLFLALPGTFYYFIGLLASGKLYMNTALATLNSRQHVYSKAHREQITCNSIPMTAQSLAATGRDAPPVNIIVTTESDMILDSEFEFKHSTFVDGML